MTALWVTPEELGDHATSEFAYDACKAASQLLWALSGRKYSGVTVTTERYISTLPPRFGPSAVMAKAELINGEIFNITSDGDGWISPESRVRLRGRPVAEVLEVRTFDGRVISADEYYLVDRSTLQFVAGSAWSRSNVEVTYTYGTPAPAMGQMAARLLAIEFVKLWSGDDDCSLPQRVTSVTRQGVSMTILDNQTFLDDLKTGIYSVDLFLKSVNPDKARARARVFSPDTPRARRYSPKAPTLPVSERDLVSYRGAPASATFAVEADTLALLSDGWLPEVVLHSYDNSRNASLASFGAEINTTLSTITVSVSYNRVLAAVLMVDPGTWDLYFAKDGDSVHVATGNLQIKMTSAP